MNEKKVTVIIPFYNEVDWLYDAVQSVFNQTYKNFEIIVVNDGSSENMDQFLSDYGNRIIYKYKENGGPASARNLALKIATGDYVAFLDSDDVWLPTKTQKQIEFMNNSGAIWSHTGYYNWYPNENKIILKKNGNDYGNVYLRSFVSLRANTPAIIIVKKYFDLHPDFNFSEQMRISEDNYLWSLISKSYPLALIEEPLIKVRQRGTNSDLIARNRFKSKSMLYNDIQQGVFQDLSKTIIFIFSLYNNSEKVINFLEKKSKLNNEQIEFLSKLLWILPFIIERIYLNFLRKHRMTDFKLKMKNKL